MTHPLRILLLDDDAFMLELLQDMLADLGHADVQAAASARAALQVLPAFRPDVLVCDLSMPEMDGIEFLRTVAADGYGGGVILLSGMDDGILRAASTLAMAQGLTILGACAKPLARAELADLLALAARQREGAGVPARPHHPAPSEPG